MEKEHSNYKNENISVVSEKLPNCVVKFEIKVQPQAVQAAHHKAIKEIKKEISIPGFRAGKAPESYIIKNYPSVIDKEWKNVTLNTAFNEAIRLVGISPLNEGYVKRPVIHHFDMDGAHFSIEFEIPPKVPQIDFEDIQIQKIRPRPTTEEDIENAIHNLTFNYVTFEPIEEQRSVEEGDFVDIDVYLTINGKSEKKIDNKRTEVSPMGLPSYLKDAIIGLQVNETAEGIMPPHEQVTNSPTLEQIPFQIKVNAIWKGIKPSPEELATQLGLSSFDEVKEKIKSNLELNAIREAEETESRLLIETLLDKYPVEIPLSVVDKNVSGQLKSFIQSVPEQNKANISALEESFKAEIIRELQKIFILTEVMKHNQIQLTQDDYQQEMANQIKLIPTGRSVLNSEQNKEEIQNKVYRLAMERKVISFLLDKVVING